MSEDRRIRELVGRGLVYIDEAKASPVVSRKKLELTLNDAYTLVELYAKYDLLKNALAPLGKEGQ